MEQTDLTGKLLVAMPGMGDPRFDRAVLLVCSHGDDGAMGLIVNKRAAQLDFGDVLSQLDIDAGEFATRPMHFGGPVEGQRGFVLHSADYDSDPSTLSVGGDLGMTATLDILRDMVLGNGPDKALVTLGYAGWAPGQLEAEIAANGWLITDGVPDLIFGPDDDGKWRAALDTLGIDPLMLSADGGRA